MVNVRLTMVSADGEIVAGAGSSRSVAAESASVVVVGAGCSGLYAAHALKQSNKHLKVVIVEANNYIGGRVLTDDTLHPHIRLPIGAEFIHEYVSVRIGPWFFGW